MQEEPKRQYSLVQRELTANAGSLAGPEWFVGVRGAARVGPSVGQRPVCLRAGEQILLLTLREVVASRACRICSSRLASRGCGRSVLWLS